MHTHTVELQWQGAMQLSSTNPSGHNFLIDAPQSKGGNDQGMHPKAMMLSALGGCSGLDIAHLIKKMRLQVQGFEISVVGELSPEEPATYTAVKLCYHFFGEELDCPQIEKAVSLSVEKYCGVLKMFEKFAQISTEIRYN